MLVIVRLYICAFVKNIFFDCIKNLPFDCEDLLRLPPGGGRGGSSLGAAAGGGGSRLEADCAFGRLMAAGIPSTSLPTRQAAIRLS